MSLIWETTIILLAFLWWLSGCRTAPVDEADAERREFIVSAVRQLSDRDMKMGAVEFGYTRFWMLQYIAKDRKLVIGEPSKFTKTQQIERKRHFKALMHTITDFQKNDMDVREFEFSPEEPRTIQFSSGKLIIGPGPASAASTPVN